jgi:hypothetical protein
MRVPSSWFRLSTIDESCDFAQAATVDIGKLVQVCGFIRKRAGLVD